MFFNSEKTTWEGEGAINVFPKDSASKNYRLESSDIEVTQDRRGWFVRNLSYRVTSATWPDGGTLELYNCTIDYPKTSSLCETNSGNYYIEIESAPEQPEPEEAELGY